MKDGVIGRNVVLKGNYKDFIGHRYQVGYLFTDVIGTQSGNGYAPTQSFKVTFVSGNKLMEMVELKYFAK